MCRAHTPQEGHACPKAAKQANSSFDNQQKICISFCHVDLKPTQRTSAGSPHLAFSGFLVWQIESHPHSPLVWWRGKVSTLIMTETQQCLFFLFSGQQHTMGFRSLSSCPSLEEACLSTGLALGLIFLPIGSPLFIAAYRGILLACKTALYSAQRPNRTNRTQSFGHHRVSSGHPAPCSPAGIMMTKEVN